MWSVINEIINKRKQKHMTRKFVVGDREIYDSKDIAEHFNNFLTNVAKNLAAKIPDTTKEATSYIEHSNLKSIFLGDASSEEISKVINCLGGMISIPRLLNLLISYILHCYLI